MSTCNFTQLIAASECIGDSLAKINNNFSNLDDALCDLASSSLSAINTATINLVYNTARNTLSGNLQPSSVTTAFIATSAITSTQLANNSVTTDKIVDNAVTSGKFADGSITNTKIANNAVTTNKINDNSVSPVKLTTGAPSWNTSGFVGIGTTLPESSLQVVGGIRVRGGTPGANGVSNNGYAFSGNSGDTDSGMYSTGDGRIEFYTSNSETMRLQTGNVGIGTTNPLVKLQVASSDTITRLVGTGSNYYSLDIRASDASGSVGRGSQILTTNENEIVCSYYAAFLNTDGSSDVFITTTPAGSRTSDRQVERLRITGAGNVGIGTASPAYKLDISGDIRASNAYFNTTANRALISDASSKVAVSSVTTTELGYVSGVTSAIQTQINSKVTANTAITGATKTKITYDSKGLVTAGADLAATDLPNHVLATDTGLGAQHTISGATAGQVLRATSATTAAMQNLIASDIPSLDTSKVTSGTFPTERIADGAITSAKISDGTIVNSDINASAAIALSKLATGALPTGITIASANIVDGSIVDGDINASAAIALSKLATGALPTGITVSTSNITDSSVTTAKISDGDITTAKIANFAVTADKLGTGSVTTAKISDGDITTAKIAVNAVTYSRIQQVATANRVLGSTTAGGTVSEVQVQTNMIADNAITSAKIAAGAVGPSELNGAQTGSAPVYGIRAWVLFSSSNTTNGTSQSILRDANVSSVTRVSNSFYGTVGNYQINFSSSVGSTTYAIAGTAPTTLNLVPYISSVYQDTDFSRTTTSCRIGVWNNDGATANCSNISVMIIA